MDIKYILQDCLLFLFLLPIYGQFESDDYEDAGAFGRCPWIRNKLKNGRVRYRYKGRVAKFLCDSGFELAGKRSSTCVRGQWSNPLPVCVARGCNRVPTVANGRVTEMYRGALLVYDCNPGYTLAGDSSIHCDGRRWNATPASCVVSIQDPETHCDFEAYDLCGWTHDPIHDFDWRRNQFSTPSGHVGTGPSFDHTFGENKAGYYLYIEASSPRKPNDVARLFSPVYHPEESGGCFIFWYHMYGTNTGGLRVYLKPESYVFNEVTSVWNEFGDHGNHWLRGNISVPVFRENFQIVIEAVRGDGYMGDSAIDDVYLTKQDCESMENETDIHPDDSTDSCRGRCQVADSTDFCGCNEKCYAADNCCSDYTSLCLETSHTLVPDTDEVVPETHTSIYETTEGQYQAQSTKLHTESPNQFSAAVLSTATNSAPNASHNPLLTTTPPLPVTSMSSTEGSISSSAAATTVTMSLSTREANPVTALPSTSLSTAKSVTNIVDTSLSSTTEKITTKSALTVGTTTSLKTSPSSTASLKSTTSTTSLKTTRSTTISLQTTPRATTSLQTTPRATTSLQTTPRTTTSLQTTTRTKTTLKTTPSTTSIKSSSVETTTEKIQSTTQTNPVLTTHIPTESTSTRSTPNESLFTEITSTQYSKNKNQSAIYLSTESSAISKLTFPISTPASTNPVITSTSTPRYNLRPRKTTTVISTASLSKSSSIGTTPTLSSTTSTTEASTVPLTFSTASRTRTSTKPLVFSTRTFAKETTQVPTSISDSRTNNFKTTKFRNLRPNILTFPSIAPTTADSFEMASSKSSDSSGTVITVVVILVICIIGGIILYIKKYKGKRQSKLDDDSEMRFLPDSDYMDYSDASALEKILVK